MIGNLARAAVAAGAVAALRMLYRALRQDRTPIPERALVSDGDYARVSGLEIHFRREGTGPPIVLAPGMLGSAQTWAPLSELLRDSFTVYSVDPPGSGLSDKPNDLDYSPAAQGKLLSCFVDEVCREPVILVAASTAAATAIEAALISPENFKRIVLISPVLDLPNGPVALSRNSWGFARAFDFVLSSRRILGGIMGRLAVDPSAAADTIADSLYLQARTPGYVKALIATIDELQNHDWRGSLDRVAVPLTIVFGAGDPIVRSSAFRTLTKNGRSIRFSVLPRCGHFPELECPNRIAALIRMPTGEDTSPAEE